MLVGYSRARLRQPAFCLGHGNTAAKAERTEHRVISGRRGHRRGWPVRSRHGLVWSHRADGVFVDIAAVAILVSCT